MARLIIVDDNRELASLIASSARGRGHVSRTVFTGKGALAALATGSYDLAIVDLLLPDMRGSEVLGHLRSHQVPAIAISGVYKGARFAREAMTMHGAQGFFEKPFDLSALLEAIERITGGVARAPPPVEPQDALDALRDLDPIVTPEPPPPPPSIKPQVELPAAPAGAGDDEPFPFEVGLAEQVAFGDETTVEEVTLTDELLDSEEPAPSSGAAASAPAPMGARPAPSSGEDLAHLLPLSDWERIWKRGAEGTPAPRRPASGGLAAAGAIAVGSVPRLLNAYYQARHDGELRLRQGQVAKLVSFEKGQPVYAASNLAHERFARFCGRKGLLSEADLSAVSSLAKEGGLRTGEAMVRLGLITSDQRRALLEEQVKEIIWSTFIWNEGEYAFSPRASGRGDLVRLSVFPGDLILEGVHRSETLVSLRGKMAGTRRLVPTADPPYALHEFKLSGPQAMLLAHADGSKSVEDLLAITDLSERDTLAALVGFELLGLVEERRDDSRRRRISFGL